MDYFYFIFIPWRSCTWSIHHADSFQTTSRGARPPVMTLPNKASHWRGSEVWSTSCTCNMNMNMVIKLCLVGVFLGFLFQAVASQSKGTSSVMTLAHDALVFVKVCVRACAGACVAFIHCSECLVHMLTHPLQYLLEWGRTESCIHLDSSCVVLWGRAG